MFSLFSSSVEEGKGSSSSDQGLGVAQIATYGATVDEAGAQATKVYEWESRGEVMTLVIETAAIIGKQVFALTMIILQVSFNKKYLMDCDDRVIGLGPALACEWTKTYVRCFPLMALVVSLMAASRYLLHHRIYYELLRHKILLNFDNFPGHKDPLFLILVWCALNAFAHFIFNLWKYFNFDIYNPKTAVQGAMGADFQKELNKVAIFYMIPTGIFLAFLYGSYDTEAQLIPLSKYIEEDPVEMRKVVANMVVLDEQVASRVTEKGHLYDAVEDQCTTADVFQELVEECRAEQEQHPDKQPDSLGAWRLVSTQWPAQILLDTRLSDDKADRFRHVWCPALQRQSSSIHAIICTRIASPTTMRMI